MNKDDAVSIYLTIFNLAIEHMECRPRISNYCAATVFSYAATHVKN